MIFWIDFVWKNLSACSVPEILITRVAERVKVSFLRRPRSHDLGSTHTLVTLLRPWIRRFTMITLSLLGGFEQAANLREKKSKRQPENLENGQLLSG